MDNIIRGTTPSLMFNFHNISVSDITDAYLTVKHDSEIAIEKTLVDAVAGDNSLTWKLTQAETLQLYENNVRIMVNWKLADGTRGASKEVTVGVSDNHKDEVI